MDELSHYVPQHTVGEHNRTSSKCLRSLSPSARRHISNHDSKKNHKYTTEPANKKWAATNEPALEAVYEQLGPEHNIIHEG